MNRLSAKTRLRNHPRVLRVEWDVQFCC